MIQKKQRLPDALRLFTSTSLLEAATQQLAAAVQEGYLSQAKDKIEHILHLIRAKRSIDELPYVQLGYSSQLQLVNALTACLNPAEVKFESPSSLNADTKIRMLALDALIDIQDIANDKNFNAITSLGNVGNAVPKIIVHDITNTQLIEAYHNRLMGWPPFVTEFGAQYEDALNELYQRSLKRGHCDEMTMGWVRSAKRQLHTVQFMGSNGTLLNCKPT